MAAKQDEPTTSVSIPSLDVTSIQLEGFVTGVKLNDKGAAITFVTAPTAALVAALGLLVAVQITGEPVGLSIDRRQMGLDFATKDGDQTEMVEVDNDGKVTPPSSRSADALRHPFKGRHDRDCMTCGFVDEYRFDVDGEMAPIHIEEPDGG